ncbi:MAG: methyltransferase regulatory domain-containing protein [Candidatus Acidiferrum sp.]
MSGPKRVANEYDSVPYPSLAFLQTHPDRLAVIATLRGMSPREVEHCRVLELACGDGSNLIPMAYGLPGSEFVGVDLARNPVEAAQAMIRVMGLENIRVEQKDVLEIEPDFGEFDYIIAHGVFAWVPENVQEKILKICGANLSARGVAFVSYNTNPAGHVRRILREMVQFQERRGEESPDRVKRGREFAEAILKATDARSPWKALLEEELRLTFHRDERVVYHDDLAEHFSPVSFAEFAGRAARHGLQCLGEAQIGDLVEGENNRAAQETLRELAHGDDIAFQQYLDFARYRRFRQSLLCRAEIPLCRDGMEERMCKLLVASPLRASKEFADGAVEFTNSRGAGTLSTSNPAIIVLLRRLEAMWPRGERFGVLADSTLGSLPSDEKSPARAGLAQAVLQLAGNSLVDLRTYHLRLAQGVSEKPEASLLARRMARGNGVATTLLHTRVQIEDDQGRRFLQLLDGTRDRQELADALAEDAGNISREEILKQVDGNLVSSYRMGLLIG